LKGRGFSRADSFSIEMASATEGIGFSAESEFLQGLKPIMGPTMQRT